MNVSIAQFQILMLTAPTLAVLLLVPGLTLNHPALVAQNAVPSAVRSAAVPGRAIAQHLDIASPASSFAGNPPFAVAAPVAESFAMVAEGSLTRYSALVSLSQPCRAP
ncbi:MAG TPA: hypothetical protein VGK19_25590 [Capsulimonadaceae bacterium]|jgi:hypothetical protein